MFEDVLTPRGFDLKCHIPRSGGPFEVLVAVHGISRNADEIIAAFAEAAGERLIVLAPRFDISDFPDYQRLGLSGRGRRADVMLDAALEQAGEATRNSTHRFHLFGFSGGAQFAHRYAMLYPHRVASLHVASAGWYTFPDPDTRWPYGLGRKRVASVIAERLPHFRAIPTTVYVGGRDTERDAALRTGPDIDRQQGRNRVERARRWAASVGCSELVTLRGAAHSFEQCCRSGGRGLHEVVTERILQIAESARRGASSYCNLASGNSLSGEGCPPRRDVSPRHFMALSDTMGNGHGQTVR